MGVRVRVGLLRAPTDIGIWAEPAACRRMARQAMRMSMYGLLLDSFGIPIRGISSRYGRTVKADDVVADDLSMWVLVIVAAATVLLVAGLIVMMALNDDPPSHPPIVSTHEPSSSPVASAAAP